MKYLLSSVPVIQVQRCGGFRNTEYDRGPIPAHRVLRPRKEADPEEIVTCEGYPEGRRTASYGNIRQGGTRHHCRSGKFLWRTDIETRPHGRLRSMPELGQGGPVDRGVAVTPLRKWQMQSWWRQTVPNSLFNLEKFKLAFLLLSKKTHSWVETNVPCWAFCRCVKCWGASIAHRAEEPWAVICLASIWPRDSPDGREGQPPVHLSKTKI